MIPTDNDISRLDYQHYVYRQIFHGNFSANMDELLTDGIRVLDIGCGTGRWSLEMAQDYPSSSFTGIDMVDLIPKTGIPDNFSFTKANILRGLPFKDNTFDYTFQRLMTGTFSPNDWQNVVKELARVTKPGGWVELVEASFALERAPSSYEKFHQALASTQMGSFDVTLANNLGNLLQAHLINIEADFVSCPIGWNGRVGDLCSRNLETFFSAVRPMMGPILRLGDAEYNEYMATMTKDFTKCKTWGRVPYAFGQKPNVYVQKPRRR